MSFTFPADLPTHMVKGGSGAQEDNRVGFKPEVGPPKWRRRTTARSKLYPMALSPYTLEQVETLDAFFQDDLQDGSLPFMFPDPMTEVTARFTFETTITYTAAGAGAWTPSFTLRKMPP